MRFRLARWLVLPAAVACLASCTAGAQRGQARPRHPAPQASQAASASRWQVVSLHGVHVRVPAAWPVTDSLHTALCGDPFLPAPSAIIGPILDALSCPAPPPGAGPSRDGVWLQPLPPGSAQPSTSPVTVAPGIVVFGHSPIRQGHLYWFWYHNVSVEVGIGPDPRIARGILKSLGYAPGIPDTRPSVSCPRGPHPNQMPEPERLARRLTLSHVGITLTPPPRADQPVISAASVWRKSGPRQALDNYRLILAIYSYKDPAQQYANGSVRRLVHHELAWVIYSYPRSASDEFCRGWGAEVFDAQTGTEATAISYSR